ncbi:MAG: hypothetical protein RLZZ33_1161 [Pseudomonadota bacterium]
MKISRRSCLFGLAAGPGLTLGATALDSDVAQRRAAYQRWVESLPKAAAPVLTKHGLIAIELARWQVLEANQAAAVDARHFYGIGNHAIVKHRRDSGTRVAEWFGERGGPIVHFNSGYVDGKELILAHSNFPQLPMASSLEVFSTETLTPIRSTSLGIRLGSLTWATRYRGHWFACFANYNDSGTTPGFDQRWTHVAKYDDRWQMLESWLFPPQVVATWGASACSGGDFGPDGLLYVTGHDASELYVLRLPQTGVTLEYLTTIDIPFEGQGWAWDRTRPDDRIIFGINRRTQEVVCTRVPVIPTKILA